MSLFPDSGMLAAEVQISRKAWLLAFMPERRHCSRQRNSSVRQMPPRAFEFSVDSRRSRHACRARKSKDASEAPIAAQKVRFSFQNMARQSILGGPVLLGEKAPPNLDLEPDPEDQVPKYDPDQEQYNASGEGYDDEDFEPDEDEVNYRLANAEEFGQRPPEPGQPAVLTDEEYQEMTDLPMPSEEVQQTLRHSIILEGLTLHSGKITCVRVMPAFAGDGKYFVMVPPGSIETPEPSAKLLEQLNPTKEPEDSDAATSKRPLNSFNRIEIPEEPKPFFQEPDEIKPRSSDEIVIEANLENARVFQDCLFVILEHSGHKIYAAEALLAALEGCGVDNARIEVEMRPTDYKAEESDDDSIFEEENDSAASEYVEAESDDEAQPLLEGQELPVSDGSALFWAEMIKQVRIRTAPTQDGEESAPKHVFGSSKIISVRDGESFITFMPGASQRISVGIDHTSTAPVIANQWISWSPSNTAQHHFRWHIAPARVYLTSVEEGLRRRAQGFFKGVLDPALIATADWTTWHELMLVRYVDEPVRRQLMEFLADISLLSTGGHSGIPRGHIIAYQASRRLTYKFLKTLEKAYHEPSQ